MAKIRVLWCLAMLFVAAYAAHAQGAVSYAFLEVVDRSNKPVAGAKVEVAGSCVGSPQTTDESGHLPKGFPIGYGDCNTHDFSISKPGFYPFRDVGLFHFGRVSSPFGELYGTRSMEVRNLRVELIAMPGGKDAGKAFDEVQRRRELFWAITDRDAPRVTDLLASGVDPDTTTDDLGGVPGPPGVPAVMYAAAAGGAATLEAFLKAGIDLRDPSYRDLLLVYLGNYPMIYRSNVPPETDSDKTELKQYRDVFAKLIAGGVDARAAGPGGETALMLAAANGDAPLLERLLALDLTVDRADDQGRTALVYATTQYGSAPTKPDIVRLLLAKGANPNVLADCTSPLMAAVAYDQSTLVKQLLAAKADPNLACPSGRNAVRALIETTRSEVNDRDRENLAMLFAAGARADFADEQGTTNLMVAVREGSVEVVAELLKRRAAVDARNTMGETALMLAMTWGYEKHNLEIAKMLLKAGADPNARMDRDCGSVLMAAARNDLNDPGAAELMRLVVDAGADVNYVCKGSESALITAIRWTRVEGVRKLLELGADVSGEQGHKALAVAREGFQYEWKRADLERIIKLLTDAGAY